MMKLLEEWLKSMYVCAAHVKLVPFAGQNVIIFPETVERK